MIQPLRPGIFCLGIATLLGCGPAHAGGEQRFSVSPGYHAYYPGFDDLHDGAYQSTISGQALLVDFDSGATTQSDVYSNNRLEPANHVGALGLEFGYRLRRNLTLHIGFNPWEQSSINTEIETWPIMGQIPDYSDLQRSATIAFDDLYAGFEQSLRPTTSAYLNPYWGVSIHQLRNISYKERYSFLFIGTTMPQHVRYLETQFKASNSHYLRLSVGNEFFLNEWISAKVEGGYAYAPGGSRKLTLESSSTDLNAPDLIVTPPTTVGSDGFAHYIVDPQASSAEYRKIELDFSGWQLAFNLNFYF